MYRTIQDFTVDYRKEAAASLANWEQLTDDSLSANAGPGQWTLGEHLWHIASLWQYVFCQDLKLWPMDRFQETPPVTAAQLAAFYRQATSDAAGWIEQNWSDADLANKVELWGTEFSRGELLHGIVKHELHHRGQMTVLMRLAGLPVKGVYGPSRDEVLAMQQQADGQ